MAKKDFMSELAKEIEASKTGKIEKIEDVNDFQPKARPRPVEDVFAMPEIEEEKAVQPQAPIEEEVEEEPVQETRKTSLLPDSYGQEQFQKVETPRRKLSPVGIAVLLGSLLLIAGLVYWFFFAPKITMPDFVGKNLNEAYNWAKQHKIESSAIATQEEFSLENSKDTVISQSVNPGKKIKEDTPITFVVSKGPDPNEELVFPSDLRNMTQDEIKEWIDEQQLLKTKITTQYSTTVPSGNVISYELKNASESDFTRGSNLSIIISKGEAPKGQVTVENFEGKTFQEIQSWANNKKLQLIKEEAYSDRVESGHIISQSTRSGEALKEGDTLTVVVSKGKGTKIPNLVGYTKEQLDAWQANKDNNVVVIPSSRYNNAPAGSVIAQSIPPGTVVDSGSVLELGVSLYLPILETHSREWLGKDYLELKAKVDEFNSKGANIQAGEYGELAQRTCSDEYPVEGMIINYVCEGGTVDSNGSTHYSAGCERPLNLDSKIGYQVSSGPCTVQPNTVVMTNADLINLSNLIAFLNGNGITYNLRETTTATYDGDDNWKNNHSTSAVKVIHNNSSYFNDESFTVALHNGDHVDVTYLNSEPVPTSTPTVVLLPSDIADLQTIINFCNENGINYGTIKETTTPSYDGDSDWSSDYKNSKIRVRYQGQSYYSDQEFTLVLDGDRTIEITYLSNK